MNNLIAASPRGTLPVRSSFRTQNSELAALWKSFGGEPFYLLRTQEGRSLSRARYRRAKEFLCSLTADAAGDWCDLLYSSAIVSQLTLSSHLLDVGFPDAWCARHIGLHVDRSFACANATGLGHECDETEHLMQILSPYWKWNRRHLIDAVQPDDGGFTSDDVRNLVSGLFDHVGEVTGHGRSSRRITA